MASSEDAPRNQPGREEYARAADQERGWERKEPDPDAKGAQQRASQGELEHERDQPHIPVEAGDEGGQCGCIVTVAVLGDQEELVLENTGGKAANGDQRRKRQQIGRPADRARALEEVPGRIVSGGGLAHLGKPLSRPLEQQLDQHRTADQDQRHHQEQSVRSKVAVVHDVGREEADEDPAQDGSQLDQGENPARFPRGQRVVGQRPAHHGAHGAERVHPDVDQEV